MKKIYGLVTSLLFLSGCATDVSSGNRVYLTPSDSAHLSNCEMLGQVQVDASIAGLFTVNQQILEIKNRLRDAAADRYPTADTVTHSDLSIGEGWGAPDSQVFGTVFRCFTK
jgi:hypothetical protein